MKPQLPPGPGVPKWVQTVWWWHRSVPMLERCRARYGNVFTIRLLAAPPFVMIGDPEQIKQVFTAPADVLHPGQGARLLEPVVGTNSVILLDEGAHVRQRKLMLPAFHGERMQRLSGLMTEVADASVASWPREEPVELHPRLQALTLEIILRTVFGLEEGERLDSLRELLTRQLDLAARPMGLLPPLQRDLGPHSPGGRFQQLRERTDALLYGLIAERRAAPDGSDVLAMLLAARHEDGSPMSDEELRDELMTLLVAGHETTASALAWAVQRLAREPAVLRRLTAEIDGGEDDAYLTATIQETLRRRPVLPNSAPRLVMQEVEVGGRSYPTGVCLVPNAYLVQHDPSLYREPYAFRPERFLDQAPGTYTWIPFGGGRRRCLGASFATLEMKIVLRAVLARTTLVPAGDSVARIRRRNITISPRDSARAVLRDRALDAEPVAPVVTAA